MLAAVGAPRSDSGQQQQLPEAKRTRSDFSEPKKAADAPDSHVRAPVSHYRMEKKPHGYAVIINNKNFDVPPSGKPLSTRDGTDTDRKSLTSVLKDLGFTVVLKENICAADIPKTFDEYNDHEDYDSFVCCILSHGKEGQVYGKDNQLVKIRDLSRKLADCESLIGKPKIFFIQACQGSEKPVQVPKPDDDKEEEDPDADVAFLPRDSDLFIGYATTPETISLRHPDNGTWYIQELCKVLRKNEHDLVTMVTQVHHAVATKPEYCYQLKDYVYRQQPQMISTLRHQVKF